MLFIRKNFSKIILSFLITTIVIMSLNSFSKSISDENKPGILNLSEILSIETLNPMLADNVVASSLISNVMEGLVGYNNKQELVPALSDSWTKEGLVYTFHIREDAVWENNTPLTAHDFEFSWKTAFSNEKAPYSYMLDNLKNASSIRLKEKQLEDLGVKALSDNLLRVELEEEDNTFLEMLVQCVFFPLNQAFYDSVSPNNYGTSKDTLLSCGPFVLTEFIFDNGYTLEKNDTYWNKNNINLTKIYMTLVKEPATQAAMFESGQLDVLNLTSDLYDKYSNEANYKDAIEEFTIPSLFYLYVSGNTQKYSKCLKNINFRKALNYSLDKKSITDLMLKNGSKPLDYLVPQHFGKLGSQYYRDYSNNINNSYDINKANQYFLEAKKELTEDELTFDISYSESEENKKLLENIKSQFETKLPGVKINLNSIPSSMFYKHLHEHTTMSAFVGWTPDYENIHTFFEVLLSNKSFNYGRYKNERFDLLVNTAYKAPDRASAWQLYKEAEELAFNDCPIIPVYEKGKRFLVNPKVKGFNYNGVTPDINFRFISKS